MTHAAASFSRRSVILFKGSAASQLLLSSSQKESLNSLHKENPTPSQLIGLLSGCSREKDGSE